MAFLIYKEELTGDKEFVYDIEKMQQEEVEESLKRDPQVLNYYSTALMMGVVLDEWREEIFHFENVVITCRLKITRNYNLRFRVFEIYLPASVFDIPYGDGKKGLTVDTPAEYTYIKRVDGYEFKNKSIRDIYVESLTTLNIDEDCFVGLTFHHNLVHKSISAYIGNSKSLGNRPTFNTFDVMSNYMKRCKIYKIHEVKLKNISKFRKAKNQVEKIGILHTGKVFKSGIGYRRGLVYENEIYDYLMLVAKRLNGIQVHTLKLSVRLSTSDKEFWDLQIEEFKKAFLFLDYPIYELSIENDNDIYYNSDTILEKVDKMTVSCCVQNW